MNILIIGGAGYIGTNLCNYLINKKFNIICLDTFWFGDFLNKRVNKIKADLQDALAKAAKVHQEAIDAANAAKAAAEAEVERFKALAEAHSKDLATQTSAQTVVATPAPATNSA